MLLKISSLTDHRVTLICNMAMESNTTFSVLTEQNLIRLILCLLFLQLAPVSEAYVVEHSGNGNLKDHIMPGSHVLGAFSEDVNTVLFYQSYVPLILKLHIPDWKQENLRLNKSLKCESDDLNEKNHICSVAYHLESLLNPLGQTMRFYKNLLDAPPGDFYEHNFSCDRIKPHFLHFSTHAGGLLPYLNELKNRCPLSKEVTITVKNVASGASEHAVMAFEKIKELQDESNKGRKGTTEWKFTQMAAYSALQNSYILSQYADSIRWSNAFTSCQAYRLDIGLVTPVMLNDSLTELSRVVHGSGYAFSLPFVNSLPHYYKIPLADCIVTSTPTSTALAGHSNDPSSSIANLLVRILVPVVKEGVNHKLVKMNKIPYLRKDKKGEKICEIQNFQSEDIFLVDTNETTGVNLIVGKVSPYCITSKLCKVPDYTHKQVVDPCVTGIITQNFELTQQHCYFECYSLPGSVMSRDKVFPIFTQIGSNRYAITGINPTALPYTLIQCNGQTVHAFHPNTTEGVIFVTLPCNCELISGRKTYTSHPPCNEPMAVEHVLELGHHHHHDTGADNLEDIVDYIVEKIKPAEYNLTFSAESPNQTDDIVSQKAEESTSASHSTPQKVTDEQHVHPVHCGHVLLWILLITLLLLNSFTLYVLYSNNVINLDFLLLSRRNTGNISRLTNDIPISNVGRNPL